MTAVYIALMFLAPVLGGIVFGAIQFAAYRAMRPAEAVPPFAILFARGLLAFFVVAVVLAITLRFVP